MMIKAACAGAIVMLSGCGTTESGFSKALEHPVTFTQAARAIAAQAEQDGIKARLVGLAGPRLTTVAALASDVCASADGIVSTDAALGAFGDSLEVLQKVAEKPADVSYTGYVAQFRKNNKSIATAALARDPAAKAAASREAQEAEGQARLRCAGLFDADLKASLAPAPDAPAEASSKALGTLLAFDAVLKGALSIAERAQREAAVRATAVALMDDLRAARLDLANTDLSTMGPRVVYAAGASAAAVKMNQTRLGAAITLHRWYTARQIKEIATALDRCGPSCLGNPAQRQNLDDAVVAMREYRALAGLDTDAALVSLDAGITQAGEAAAGKVKMTELLDGLLTIADSLSGLDQSVAAYRASRK